MIIFYEVKADLSEEDIVYAWQRARVNKIRPGIESLATSTLKLMKKGTTVFPESHSVEALRPLCRLQRVWNLLVGFPGETEPVYQRYMEVLPLVFRFCLLPPAFIQFGSDRFESLITTRPGVTGVLICILWISIPSFTPSRNLISAISHITLPTKTWRQSTSLPWRDGLESCGPGFVSGRPFGTNQRTRVPPRLYFKENSTTIYDSRSGSVRGTCRGRNRQAGFGPSLQTYSHRGIHEGVCNNARSRYFRRDRAATERETGFPGGRSLTESFAGKVSTAAAEGRRPMSTKVEKPSIQPALFPRNRERSIRILNV